MAKWAVFDVDGTLFPSSSLEKKFILSMLKHGVLPLENIFYYLLKGLFRSSHQSFTDSFKSNKYYLKYISVETIQQAVRILVNQYILPRISVLGLEKIAFFRDQSYRILIMSGSPIFLLEPLRGVFKYDHLISSNLEVKNGLFTGEIKGLHPYGKRKTSILRILQKKLDIDFPKSIVFANHHSDIHHMLLFGAAVAVNPDNRLLNFAESKHWDIQYWI